MIRVMDQTRNNTHGQLKVSHGPELSKVTMVHIKVHCLAHISSVSLVVIRDVIVHVLDYCEVLDVLPLGDVQFLKEVVHDHEVVPGGD